GHGHRPSDPTSGDAAILSQAVVCGLHARCCWPDYCSLALGLPVPREPVASRSVWVCAVPRRCHDHGGGADAPAPPSSNWRPIGDCSARPVARLAVADRDVRGRQNISCDMKCYLSSQSCKEVIMRTRPTAVVVIGGLIAVAALLTGFRV